MAVVQVASQTDIGHRRDVNEDSMLVGSRIWAVADGMGGHAAGDVASSLMVKRLKEFEDLTDFNPTDVINLIHQANDDILSYAKENPQAWGLGTTISGVAEVIVDGTARWAIFNVGDSRVYRFLDGEFERATVDHSETEELIRQGKITEEDARNHHLRNIITRSVGAIPPPDVDLWVLPQTEGELFLVCSDGLTSEVTDDRIAQILVDAPDVKEAATVLVSEVLAGEARDNITVVLVQVDSKAKPNSKLDIEQIKSEE